MTCLSFLFESSDNIPVVQSVALIPIDSAGPLIHHQI